MTWVRVDDQFPDHPKVLTLGRDRLAAMGLWIIGTCYAARHLTDGFVPYAVLPAGSQRLADRLVEVGIWSEKRGGYYIHDYDHYQPSRQYVLEQRAKNARRQRDWRDAVSRPVTNDASSAVSESAPAQTHTRPVPSNGSYPPKSPNVDKRQEARIVERMKREHDEEFRRRHPEWNPGT